MHDAAVTWTADEAFTILSTTPSVRDVVGWEPAELVGQCGFDLLAPAERADLRRRWQDMLRTGAPFCLDLRVPHKDGSARWVRQTIKDLRHEPAMGCIVGSAVDVTAEREAVERAEGERARYRAIFSRSKQAKLEVDRSGVVRGCNDSFAALTGHGPGEVTGKHLLTLCTEVSADERAAVAGVLAGTRADAQFECSLAGAHGLDRPVLVSVSGIDDDITGLGALVSFQDLGLVKQAQQRNHDLEQFYDALAGGSSEVAVVTDMGCTVRYASPSLTQLLGFSPDQVRGETSTDYVHPDDVVRAHAAVASVVESGDPVTVRLRMRSADGGWRWVEDRISNHLDTPIRGLVSNIHDVTAEVEAERALRISEARYRAIAELAEEGIWVVSPDGRTLYANARMADILGHSLDELTRRPMHEVFGRAKQNAVRRRLATRRTRGTECYEIDYPHPDGTSRRLRVTASPMASDDPAFSGSLAMVSDVTAEHTAQERLHRAAVHDWLTGLPNRALLMDRLERSLAQPGAEVVVAVIDLDRFKLINDVHGHAAGDEVLAAVASRLAELVGPGDTLARFGGDEFALVLQGSSPSPQTIGERVLAALASSVVVGGHHYQVGASVGVATTETSTGAVELFRHADAAMYAAKATGRGQARVFTRGLADETARRYLLAVDLREALSDGSLHLHYQPVVDLTTGRVRGFEALVRWDHEHLGAVAPDVFVDLAETAGLAAELDKWVITRAIEESAPTLRGRPDGDWYVAVNLSAATISDPSIAAHVVDTASQHGLSPEQLMLEVTERGVMTDPQAAVEALRGLRAQGFKIALDDFGTGQSSLAYLRELPVTTLKIDRSFVQGVDTNADATAIVVSIVHLAKAVGLTVTAEGVETEALAGVLRDLGCDAGQGWLWSRALPFDEAKGLDGRFAVTPVICWSPSNRKRTSTVIEAEHGLTRIMELHRQGASLATIAAALNREGWRRPEGQRWNHVTVAHVIASAASSW